MKKGILNVERDGRELMVGWILEAKDLAVERAGYSILSIPHLALSEGEVLALIGPNGAGKTTLLQALCYLVRGFRGEILFKSERVGAAVSGQQYRRKVTMVFQEPMLFDATVRANVAAPLRFRKVGRREADAIVEENLDRFGIGHLRGRSARTLSGGEAQRTALARAFAARPEVVLLDEPFSALDAPTREGLVDDLEKVIRESGTTAIFATHDRTEALRMSDRIGVMNMGSLVQIGPPEEVMNRPANEFVASFVGVETVLQGRVVRVGEGTFIASASGKEIEAVGLAKPGDKVLVCIRPEYVTLSLGTGSTATSARNVFQGRIERVTPLGLYHKVQVDCGFPLVAYVTANSVRDLLLTEGTNVIASFKATAIHAIVRS